MFGQKNILLQIIPLKEGCMNYGSVCFQRFAFIFKRLKALYFFVVLITCLHFTAYPGTKSLYVVVRMCRQVQPRWIGVTDKALASQFGGESSSPAETRG